MSQPDLFLCGGLQSSGSTLISWCFLQRGDMDGVLDANNDLLPAIDSGLGRPHVWYKTTISCFRLAELARHYADGGWCVRPLLVVRDLRDVWASLITKRYTHNGITAEDPPLRMRLRRFAEDWDLSRRLGWPTLRYESFASDPETTLHQTCDRLGLSWDEAILLWPKQPNEIANAQWGNDTFWATRGPNLAETLSRHVGRRSVQTIAAADLAWLEHEFHEFNVANGYPLEREQAATGGQEPSGLLPSFEATRRYEWETKRKPLRRFLSWLGIPNRRLIRERTWKTRAA
jgi:hypothetical protein